MSDETPTWPTSQELQEEFLRKLAEQNGGTVQRDNAGRLTVIRDLRQLLGPRPKFPRISERRLPLVRQVAARPQQLGLLLR